MGIIPGPLVLGPEPIGRRYGLLTAASGPLDLPERGRGGGLRYTPVTCGQAHPYPIGCYGGLVEVPEGGKPTDPEDPLTEARVFGVVAGLECGAAGYSAVEFQDKVRRRLENGEQGATEQALWTGLDEDGNTLDIESLSDSPETITVSDDLDIVHVLAAMENWAYLDQGYGNVAYIHAPVVVASHAADRGLVVQDRNLKRTPFGSVWIFGGGYPGTGTDGVSPPTGGTYLHITGQVQVWRSSDIFVYPADQTMNRTNNQRLLIAEREYAIGFDCMNGRALFDPLGGAS